MKRRGELGDQVVIFSFLFFMVIISGGIAVGTYIYYGSGYDFRQVEADALAFRVESCLLSNEIDWALEGNFYEVCDISRESIEANNILRIEIDDSVVLNFRGSEVACGFSGDNEELPKCRESVFFLGDSKVKILAGSEQRVERVNVG